MTTRLLHGDCLDLLPTLEAGSVRCCVTSPPYYGLRDYGHAGQIGLEDSPEAYVARLVGVFRAVRRVLADDGTLFLNLGDRFANKQLLGIPWRVAFALQSDGWVLRNDCIWHKTNAMPDGATDRATRDHEYLFHFAARPRYYYDTDAVREPHKMTSWSASGDRDGTTVRGRRGIRVEGQKARDLPGNHTFKRAYHPLGRNRRTVWSIPTTPLAGLHFAPFPPALVEPCVLAGSALGDTILDPFCGSGTVGAVALGHGRGFVGIDLNADYLNLAEKRIAGAQPPLPMAAD